MNLSFDPTVPAELAAAQRMLAALSAPQTVTVANDTSEPIRLRKIPTLTAADMHMHEMIAHADCRLEKIQSICVATQQCDSMDDTGGIRSVPVPPVAASYTAAAPASPSAPEAPQAGAAVDPSVFGQSAVSAPVPAVPSAPAVPTSPAAGGERDVSGLPWDERIHSKERTKNADGSWRYRRFKVEADKAIIPVVEAELRAAKVNPPPIVITGQSDVTAESSDLVPAAPAVSAPPLPPAAPVPPRVPSLPAIPTSTPPAAAPAPAAATASGEPMVADGDFVALFGKVTKLLAAQGGVFGEEDVHAINEKLGLLPAATGMMLLPTRPELVLQYDAAVEELFA